LGKGLPKAFKSTLTVDLIEELTINSEYPNLATRANILALIDIARENYGVYNTARRETNTLLFRNILKFTSTHTVTTSLKAMDNLISQRVGWST